ncbi:MAG TPA: PH domain-containing protein [Thermoanaerobaculia bacterium]
MSWRETVLRVMHVPPTPQPPPGAPPRLFRAAPNYLALRAFVWGLTQLFAIVGLTIAIVALANFDDNMPRLMAILFHVGEAFGIVALVAQILFGWMILRLDYELRWYMLSDRAIRIREGITTVREKTIALANIQNISIRQGPLQRLLKIADVEVKTAGGGGRSSAEERKQLGREPMHVAYFRGVDNAEEIRDALREGVQRERNSGLGDLDEHHAHDAGGDVASAVAELLEESRKLRVAASMPQAAWRAAPPE